MSNAAKLKKRAVEFEQKKQFDKALALYVQVLEEEQGEPDAEPEVALYNRVGDLHLRAGNTGEAIGYYRRAVQLYTESGFLNNAIALCNKILRHDPEQTEVHYTLGRISATKGFRSDAKAHFLEYAQRMQRMGELDESFRALKEFADLCPDQDDIRLMLAELLTKQGRSEEAVEQLQLLHEKLSGEGRDTEARATAERMAAIDPEAAPRAGSGSVAPKSGGGLVFLDVSWEQPRSAPERAVAATPAAARAVTPPSTGAVAGPAAVEPLDGLETAPLDAQLDAAAIADAPLVDAEPHEDGAATEVVSILDAPGAGTEGDAAPAAVEGFESTALELDVVAEAPELVLDPGPVGNDDFGLRDLEPRPELAAPPSLADLPLLTPEFLPAPAGAAPLPAPAWDDPDLDDESEGPELDLIMPEELDREAEAALAAPEAPLDLVGNLPMLEPLPPLEPPMPVEAEPVAVAAPTTPAFGNDAPPETFVNLGDWLRDEEPPKSTRMVVDAVEPGEGEEFDFADMLRKFKRGVSENVDEDDHASHHDLGIAFREMGLVDEAIAEFQKALRAPGPRVRTYEALGQCFVDKGQFQVAVGVLGRAVTESPDDDQLLVGVLYLLGVATEALGRGDDAIGYFQRVFAVDINFQDVEDRLSALERTTR
jgi:tetratricopeptide (TPR) repeat protein